MITPLTHKKINLLGPIPYLVEYKLCIKDSFPNEVLVLFAILLVVFAFIFLFSSLKTLNHL
jgi:hypothetical protein